MNNPTDKPSNVTLGGHASGHAAQRVDHSARPDIVPGYQSGFANEFATEALPGALPQGRNSPQRAPYGLYAEQLSGTTFTAPRSHNRRSWLYRIRPAAVHQPFTALPSHRLVANFHDVPPTPPNQLRWDPLPMPAEPSDFTEIGRAHV